MLKRTIKGILQMVLPANAYLDFLIWKRGFSEPELRLIPYLCAKSKITVDVGASDGLFLAPARRYSKHCYAFEPRSNAKKDLDFMFRQCANVTIEEFALSNYNGEATLQILNSDEWRSTIEKENDLNSQGTIRFVTVPVIKLDDYQFQDEVGFIKIDVEGHEENVLKGSMNIIKKSNPNILVEIEERHNIGSFSRVQFLLQEEGYKGFAFREQKLIPIEGIAINDLQNKLLLGTPNYINNFIFIHKQRVENSAPLFKLYA